MNRSPLKRTKKVKSSTFAPWVKAVPESTSHGSGSLQKRLWRLTSDYVRIRDWYKYGTCVATGAKIRHWSEGDAGHWKSYSVCRGLFKFETTNIHLQSKTSNGWGGQEIGHQFGETLKQRYGEKILDDLTVLNQMHDLKVSSQQLTERMKMRLEQLGELPEQPEYYARVISLLANAVKV